MGILTDDVFWMVVYTDQDSQCVGKADSWYCGLWCGVKFPSYPATKSQSILLHNLDTIQLWTKI